MVLTVNLTKDTTQWGKEVKNKFEKRFKEAGIIGNDKFLSDEDLSKVGDLLKEAGFLDGDTTMWAGNVFAELSDRLHEIEGWIQQYKTITPPDEKGDAVGLVILQGAKAFVPVVIKEWEIQPMDIIIYKQNKDIKYAFLSKRNLLNLLVSSSIGKPQNEPNKNAILDAYINLLSPAGGGPARSANPFYGTGYKSKLASHASELFKKQDFAKDSILFNEIIKDVEPKEYFPYAVLYKNASNEIEFYTPRVAEDGIILTVDQASELLNSTIDDTSLRIEKVASLNAGKVIIVNNIMHRTGNIMMEQESMDDVWSRDKQQCLPPIEGLYYVNGEQSYINPNVRYFDGSRSSYGLLVGKGRFTLAKTINFEKPTVPESVDLSKEEILPEMTKDDLRVGVIGTILHDHEKWATIPFKIQLVSFNGNILTITVRPLIGMPEPINITFYNKDNVVKVNETNYLFPIIFTRLCALPDYVQNFVTYPGTKYKYNITVSIRGGNSYLIHEHNNPMGPFNPGKLFFYLVYRYGFSEPQARIFINRLHAFKQMKFKVKNILTEPDIPQISPDINLDESDINMIDNAVKVASGLYKHKDFPKDVAIDMMNVDNAFLNIYDEIFEKSAKEILVGGKGDFKSLKEFSPKEVRMGLKEEREHTANKKTREEIVKDHLSEDKKYYSKMEEEKSKKANVKLAQAPQVEQTSSGSSANAEQRVDSNVNRLGAHYQSGALGGSQNIISYLMQSKTSDRNTREIIDLLSYYATGNIRPQEVSSIASELDSSLGEAENNLCKTLLISQLDGIPGHDPSDIKVLLSALDNYRGYLSSSIVISRLQEI